MQPAGSQSVPSCLSAKDVSMLDVAISAALGRRGDLSAAARQAQLDGVTDAELEDILDQVATHVGWRSGERTD